MMGVNTRNMCSCLQKYNKLNTVASFWTIIKFNIILYCLPRWLHVSITRPSSGHIYKTYNKVACSANDVIVI